MQLHLLLPCAALLSAAAAAAAATPRYAMYFDQYHKDPLPTRNITAGITHVITAFAQSASFANATFMPTDYKPFMNLSDIRALFDDGTKVCMGIGGWGDNAGFGVGAADESSRKLYARNIKATLDYYGYQCVDVDWEYVGGNGADYRQVPNSDRVSEITTYPLLLQEIKAAIGGMELSTSVPGKEVDMMGYTKDTVPAIAAACDFINVMAYDLMNRRQNVTTHHTSVNGSITAIQAYLDRGMPASKMLLGFAFYAKYFKIAPNATCHFPIGCPTELLEDENGTDTGKSGAMTFEDANFLPPPDPNSLTQSSDGSCGGKTGRKCSNGNCCSIHGFCGTDAQFCGSGCQVGFGNCTDNVSLTMLFQTALREGCYDVAQGGEWFIDQANHMFWTWDTAEIITRKFTEIVKPFGLPGVMAWSLVEDSHDWSHITALQQGVKALRDC